VATIIWWHAQPGLLQLVALDVMIVSTVSTLLVNGNPLLRYDGYYILADLCESPNLWQRSRDVLRQLFAKWVLGQRTTEDAIVPVRQRAWLAAYAVASQVYLAIVLVAIVWGLAQVLYPWHLENLAYMLGFVMLGGVMIGPVTRTARMIRSPLLRREARGGRLATAAVLALAAAVAVLTIPVNYYVRAPLVLLPENATRVYATVDGLLEAAAPAGEQVEAGDTIAKLVNPDVERELVRLAGQHDSQRLRLAHLELLRGSDPEASAQLPAARAALADLEQQLSDLRRDADRLTLTAPAAGTLIAAPGRARGRSAAKSNGRLEQWSGALLDEANRGALVEAGTLVGLVGDPKQLDAVLLVEDTDVARLASGQAARVRLDQLPGQVLTGEVVDAARRDAQDAVSSSAAQADLESLFAGLVRPGQQANHYQARVRFAMPDEPLAIGGRGEAKIAAERITLGRWLWRYLAQTFRLPG
jgi:putative peptide zinc metalloprotease protein